MRLDPGTARSNVERMNLSLRNGFILPDGFILPVLAPTVALDTSPRSASRGPDLVVVSSQSGGAYDCG
jgi:hypothetical protein